MYTYFLLTAEKDFFVGVKSSDYEKLEDCTLTLIALLPDEEAQKRLTTSYFKMRDEGKPIRQAAILTLGQITIYLNAALEFTEVATGALI